MFFLKSIPGLHNLSFGWIALLGLTCLLIISREDDLDHCIHQVEWSTLLFFACLFILMENLTKLGLIKEIASIVESILESVKETRQLTIAICLIIWVRYIFINLNQNRNSNIYLDYWNCVFSCRKHSTYVNDAKDCCFNQ